MVVIPAYAIYLTVRNQKSWNGFLPCRWQCLEHSHPSNDLRKLCLWQCSVGKCLHQMDFLCRVEAVEQFKHVSVKFADVGYFHIEPHTLTSKNLIRANFHPPAHENRKLLQAFGCTIKVEVTVISHPTDAQFKPLPPYRFDNGWNGESKCKPLIELCSFHIPTVRLLSYPMRTVFYPVQCAKL